MWYLKVQELELDKKYIATARLGHFEIRDQNGI